MGVKTKEREVRIEYMRLDEIQRDPTNPKDHDLSALAESLERFGFVSPMGINEKTGKLLWGHGRLDDLIAFMDEGKSALEGVQVDDDGMWKAPVVRGVHLNSKDGTAYLISDNRQVELGGWNEPKLVETLIRVAGKDGRGLRGTGFDGDDVDTLIRLYRPDLLNLPEDTGPQIDRAAELQKKWGTELGQIWELGDHRLAVGDCTDKAVVDAVMMGERVGLGLTSPPYFNQRPEYATFSSYQEYNSFLSSAIDQIIVNADNPFILAWNTGDNQPDCLPMIADQTVLIHSKGLTYLETIVWRKAGAVYSIPRSAHIRSHQYYYPALAWEPVIIFRRGDKMPRFDKIDIDEVASFGMNVWEINQVVGSKQRIIGHPAIYPVELAYRVIMAYSSKRVIVIDPFLGSGTTMVACERLDRRCRAIEIFPPYAAVAIQRWVDMTGLEPRLMTL